MNFAMATLGLKEMGKFLGEGREKSLPSWLSQFSFAKQRQLTAQGRHFSLPSQRNFLISFKPKVAIAEFFWKLQRKTWYSILGLDAMPLSLKNLLLNQLLYVIKFWDRWKSCLNQKSCLNWTCLKWKTTVLSKSRLKITTTLKSLQ
jgi:hypothetical protein